MNGLGGILGTIFGYGPGTSSAASQLAGQGVSGPAQLSTGEEEQNAAQQQAILAQLQGEAAGTGPSVAQSQLSAGIQQALAAQQAAASGGRYGQNASLRQRDIAASAAGMQAGAANQAAQMRAQERQAGISGASALSSQMRNQALQSAAANMQGQETYNQQLAGLYGQEQGQQAQAGMNLQNSMFNALGGASSLGTMGGGSGVGETTGGGTGGPLMAMMAHGGVSGGTKTDVGEHGPEILVPEGHRGHSVLITRPMLLALGRRGRDVVLPLEQGSAPYHPGPQPTHVEARPTAPAPKHPAVKPEALRALAGRGEVFSPGPNAAPLSPVTAGIVHRALAKHGIHPAAAHGAMVAPHIVGRLRPSQSIPSLSPRLLPHMAHGGIVPGALKILRMKRAAMYATGR